MTAVVPSAPLAVRPDTYVVDLPDGVEVVTGSGSTFLAGEAVRRWVPRLLASIDGRRSLDDVLAGADPARRAAAERVVAALVDAGAVGWTGSADVPRRAPVVALAAPGPLHARLRAALGRAGLDDVRDANGVLADVDVVLHVTDGTAPAVPDVPAGVRLVEVVIDGPEVWWCRGRDGVRWADVRARLDGLDARAVAPAAPLDRTAADVLAGMLVQDLVADPATAATASGATVFTPASLGSRRHPVRVHPFGLPAVGEDGPAFLERVRRLSHGPALDPEEMSRGAASLMDSRTGLFGVLGQGSLAQVPLKVVTTRVADPVGHRVVTVTEADIAFPDARRRAGARALAAYASLAVDPRRLVPLTGGFAQRAAADPWGAVDDLAAGRADASCRALDLLDGRAVLVDARAAFPPLDGTSVRPGVGTGPTWAAAVEDALLQLCGRWSVDRATVDGRVPEAVRWRDVPATARLRDLTVLVDALGADVQVLDLTGPGGVPALLSTVDGVPSGHGAGRTYPQALASCLLATLGVEQGVVPRPAGCLIVAGGRDTRPVPPGSELDLDGLAAGLARLAGPPRVVPLDHDPAVVAVAPYVLRVVLDER